MSARRLRPPVLLTAAAAVGALAAAAIAIYVVVGDSSDDVSEPVLADERIGALRGVRFGDRAAEVRARLGEPTDDEDGFFPAGADYTGPPGIPSPASDQRPPRAPEPLHYDDTAYLVSPTLGVFSMATLAEDARTRSGIAIGDELARVRAEYRRVDCGEAVASEPLFGGDNPTYPWCHVILGEIRAFFGGDPIESITLTRLSR